VRVEIVRNERVVDSSPTQQEFEREVKIRCDEKVMCVAKTRVILSDESAIDLIAKNTVGIGQLFRHLGILPDFQLLNVCSSSRSITIKSNPTESPTDAIYSSSEERGSSHLSFKCLVARAIVMETNALECGESTCLVPRGYASKYTSSSHPRFSYIRRERERREREREKERKRERLFLRMVLSLG